MKPVIVFCISITCFLNSQAQLPLELSYSMSATLPNNIYLKEPVKDPAPFVATVTTYWQSVSFKGSGMLSVAADEPGASPVTIWNTSGNLVHFQTAKLMRGNNSVWVQPVNELERGLYIVKILIGNKPVYAKWIVQ